LLSEDEHFWLSAAGIFFQKKNNSNTFSKKHLILFQHLSTVCPTAAVFHKSTNHSCVIQQP